MSVIDLSESWSGRMMRVLGICRQRAISATANLLSHDLPHGAPWHSLPPFSPFSTVLWSTTAVKRNFLLLFCGG